MKGPVKAEVVPCAIIHDHGLDDMEGDGTLSYFPSLKSTCILTMKDGVCTSVWIDD